MPPLDGATSTTDRRAVAQGCCQGSADQAAGVALGLRVDAGRSAAAVAQGHPVGVALAQAAQQRCVGSGQALRPSVWVTGVQRSQGRTRARQPGRRSASWVVVVACRAGGRVLWAVVGEPAQPGRCTPCVRHAAGGLPTQRPAGAKEVHCGPGAEGCMPSLLVLYQAGWLPDPRQQLAHRARGRVGQQGKQGAGVTAR